jgi:hypothetical protein
MLLAQAERMTVICGRFAASMADPRDPGRVIHRLGDIFLARMLVIACGYEDGDELDTLRDDPDFRLALGKLPGSGARLANQPTMSRWENAPGTRELAKRLAAMIDIYCASYPAQPQAVTLDIDDACDVVHAYQQLTFWNGHHGIRCFLPTNAALRADPDIVAAADACAVRRAKEGRVVLRSYAETRQARRAGTAGAVSQRGSRPARSASTSATSSLR